jgi:competence protein ComEC
MELLSVVNADRIYMPDVLDSNGIRQRIQERFKDKIFYITDRTELDISGGKITLYPGITGENDNESSLCILFQPQTCDILITGDRNATGERALLKEAQLPKMELLVAGHHGSHLATSLELLMATQPEVVAISVGADNRYGHPREELLDRLSRFGCEIYRTDLQGTIIFRR